jgi:hypothetical protein
VREWVSESGGGGGDGYEGYSITRTDMKHGQLNTPSRTHARTRVRPYGSMHEHTHDRTHARHTHGHTHVRTHTHARTHAHNTRTDTLAHTYEYVYILTHMTHLCNNTKRHFLKRIIVVVMTKVALAQLKEVVESYQLIKPIVYSFCQNHAVLQAVLTSTSSNHGCSMHCQLAGNNKCKVCA